jgi:hypothetical protein
MKQNSLLFLLILLACPFTYAQQLPISKENLTSIFKESTKGEPLNLSWTASNEENSFEKLDTIVFYNNQNFQQEKNGCNYKNWRFIDAKTFQQNESMICAEPTEETVYPDRKGLFTIELKEKNNQLFLATIQKGQKVTMFKVIGLEEVVLDEFTGKSFKLTLLRIKKKNKISG